jgi:hypothetical protein
MARRARHAWLFALLALCGAPTPTRAGIDVEPDALQHYSFCISQAKDRNFVSVLDRHLLYRCHDDVAVSYFNYLGRRHVPDRVVEEPDGVFVYRHIDSVGRCWHKISDELGRPASFYGCDVYIEL